MTSTRFAKQKSQNQLAWLTGDTVLFRGESRDSTSSFIHRNLLRARCAWTTFVPIPQESRHYYVYQLDEADESSFTHFLLWIYCDKVAPFTKDWESEYVSAFKFAQKYHLDEFEQFLEDKFASSAASYYGSDANGEVHNPTIAALIIAANKLQEDSKISEFLIEQFVRSWIWRRAYSDKEFYDLVDKHPNVAKLLFRRTQDVVKMDAGNAVATFGKCGLKSPVHDGERVEDKAVVVTEEQQAEATKPFEKVVPSPHEPEESAAPAAEDRADGPLLQKKPTKPPRAGWEYKEVTKKKGKKRWREVWSGERNRDEPSTEAVIEEAPMEVVVEDAQPEGEDYESAEVVPEPEVELAESYRGFRFI